MPDCLLQITNLTVRYRSASSNALEEVSFDLCAGESLGLLGESGAGKSTLACCLAGLGPTGCEVTSGSIRFEGIDILQTSERRLQKIRGARISRIFQEPELALNPVVPVGEQIGEVLRSHATVTSQRRREVVAEMLEAVGLPDRKIYAAFSHELSGGQRQRVVIAQALIAKPSLVVADEPTSALDNVTQAEIVQLLVNLRRRFRIALIFVTHNPTLLGGLADRVLVMRQGRIVEVGTFEQIYWRPTNPHTMALVKPLSARITS